MKEDWKRFYLPMVGFLVILTVLAHIFSWRYGTSFWSNFLPQFWAVIFGVAVTIMFTYALWQHQQRVQQSQKRRQLVADLKFEVGENLKRIKDTYAVVYETGVADVDSFLALFVSSVGRLSLGHGSGKRLRTVAMKQILEPENLVPIANPDLEDTIHMLLAYVEQYNAVFDKAANQLFADLKSDKGAEEVIGHLRKCIGSGRLGHLEGCLTALSDIL